MPLRTWKILAVLVLVATACQSPSSPTSRSAPPSAPGPAMLEGMDVPTPPSTFGLKQVPLTGLDRGKPGQIDFEAHTSFTSDATKLLDYYSQEMPQIGWELRSDEPFGSSGCPFNLCTGNQVWSKGSTLANPTALVQLVVDCCLGNGLHLFVVTCPPQKTQDCVT